jgi:hypothetical protein
LYLETGPLGAFAEKKPPRWFSLYLIGCGKVAGVCVEGKRAAWKSKRICAEL